MVNTDISVLKRNPTTCQHDIEASNRVELNVCSFPRRATCDEGNRKAWTEIVLANQSDGFTNLHIARAKLTLPFTVETILIFEG